MAQKPILQVALDFIDMHRALLCAKEAVAGGVDWIEAGTPLIKAEGLNAIRELHKAFPKNYKTLFVQEFPSDSVRSPRLEKEKEPGAESHTAQAPALA